MGIQQVWVLLVFALISSTFQRVEAGVVISRLHGKKQVVIHMGKSQTKQVCSLVRLEREIQYAIEESQNEQNIEFQMFSHCIDRTDNEISKGAIRSLLTRYIFPKKVEHLKKAQSIVQLALRKDPLASYMFFQLLQEYQNMLLIYNSDLINDRSGSKKWLKDHQYDFVVKEGK